MNTHLSIVATVDSRAGVMRDFLAAVGGYAASRAAATELILVDDLHVLAADALTPAGSNGLAIKVLRNPHREGQFRAMLRGIAAASGDCVITIDPDMAANVIDIDRLLAAFHAGVELVLACRVGRADTVPSRRLASAVLNIGSRCLSGVPLRDINCPLRLFSPAAAQFLLSLEDRPHAFSLDMYDRFAGTLREIPVVVPTRPGSSSHYGYGELLRRCIAQLAAAWQFRRRKSCGTALR